MTRRSDLIVDVLVALALPFAMGGGGILGMIVADRALRGLSLSMDTGYAILGVAFLVFSVIGFFALFGPYLYLLRGRRKRRERDRALEEWADLRDGFAEARQRGVAVEQYLHQRGYRIPGVIRWIALDLARELHEE